MSIWRSTPPVNASRAPGSQQEHEAPRGKNEGESGAHDHQVYAAVGIHRDTAPVRSQA
jgi:hypothetical protein